jgi:hypothetical protein
MIYLGRPPNSSRTAPLFPTDMECVVVRAWLRCRGDDEALEYGACGFTASVGCEDVCLPIKCPSDCLDEGLGYQMYVLIGHMCPGDYFM